MHPTSPRRVLFHGVTGSGKSTAARAYADRTGLPCHLVDEEIGWLPGWRERPVAEQRALVAGIAAQERWVLDSAYSSWRDIVLARTDLIVALDYARWRSFARLLRRSLRRARTGEAVCNGNRESWRRLASQESILRWHTRSFSRKRHIARAWQAAPTLPPVLIFRRPRELRRWLAQLPDAAPAPAPAPAPPNRRRPT